MHFSRYDVIPRFSGGHEVFLAFLGGRERKRKGEEVCQNEVTKEGFSKVTAATFLV